MTPSSGRSEATVGVLMVLGAAVAWGLIGVFSRGLLDAGVGALEIAFWRAALAGAGFVVHAALRGRLRLEPERGAAKARDAAAFAAFGLVGVTLFYAALTLAIDLGGVALAFILLYTAPAFVALSAPLLLGEALTRRTAALVALATGGVALVAIGGEGAGGGGIDVSFASVGWGLAAGASYASYYLFGKRTLRRYPPAAIYAFALPVGALGLWPLVEFAPKSAAAWTLIGAMALISTYLAYLLYFAGLQRLAASRAVLVATVEPVVAALLAAALFGERLGAWGIVGGVLVVGAAAAASLPGGRGRNGTA